jgi:integrase
MSDKTIKWYGDGLYSKTRPGRDGKPEETFYGRVWVKSLQKMITFTFGHAEKTSRRELVSIQDDPEKAMRARAAAVEAAKQKKAPALRFGELVDRFEAEYRTEGGNACNIGFAPSWRAFFHNPPLAAITRQRVASYRDYLRREGYGDSTVRKYVGGLGTMFRWGMFTCDPPVATLNPAEGVERPPEPDHLIQVLTSDEQDRLLQNCGEHLRPMVELCIESGLRRGEALSLTWAQIEHATGNILIHKSKTAKPRAIPLTPTLTAILARVTKQDDSPLVFHNEDGNPWQERAASRSLERALERAGIRVVLEDGDGEYQGVFNLLRHTFGSRLAAAGADFGRISKLMGNSVRVCEKHYIRFAQSDLKAAMMALHPETGARTGASVESATPKPIRRTLQLVKG